MGMPSITISFTEAAKTFIERSERAVVGLILKGTVPTAGPVVTITRPEQIATSGLDTTGKAQATLAMMGCEGLPPRKLICYVLASNAAAYTDAYTYFDTVKDLDYIAVPTVATDEKEKDVADWVTAQRAEYKKVKAVLPNYNAASIGVINFGTASMTSGETSYATADYCSRIAGLLAACPITEASTFKVLEELDGCTKLSRSDLNTAIDAGKLCIFWDGEKVKIARGVNSLVATTETMGAQFKKIHVVEVMDMIQSDVRLLAEDHYIGRYTNSYDNKCLLLAAVGNYLADLERQQLIRVRSLDIDIDANRAYLQTQGIDTTDMTDQELKEAPTGSTVYMTATINIFDAIEDIVLPITV